MLFYSSYHNCSSFLHIGSGGFQKEEGFCGDRIAQLSCMSPAQEDAKDMHFSRYTQPTQSKRASTCNVPTCNSFPQRQFSFQTSQTLSNQAFRVEVWQSVWRDNLFQTKSGNETQQYMSPACGCASLNMLNRERSGR